MNIPSFRQVLAAVIDLGGPWAGLGGPNLGDPRHGGTAGTGTASTGTAGTGTAGTAGWGVGTRPAQGTACPHNKVFWAGLGVPVPGTGLKMSGTGTPSQTMACLASRHSRGTSGRSLCFRAFSHPASCAFRADGRSISILQSRSKRLAEKNHPKPIFSRKT